MKQKEIVLTLAREIPLFSTEQVARLYMNNGSPSKRASELLKKLEAEKLIEGRRREIGKTKVWRLSSIGRKSLKVDKPPLPFNSAKVEHVLGIGNIFLSLLLSGRLRGFQYEPKDAFTSGRRLVYAPDAFFVLDKGGAFLLEYQRSPLSSTRWAQKWAVASAFFDSGAFKSASWQPPGAIKVKPRIIVISKQEPETISSGSSLSLVIKDSIDFLL